MTTAVEKRWAAILTPAQPGAWPAPLKLCCLQWRSHHTDALLHCWTHGKAFAVCLLVFNPFHGWANWLVVQVVLLRPFIAQGKSPGMLGLSAAWAEGPPRWEKMRASND